MTRPKLHALEIAREFMDLHRVHWPQFEGESEVRPLESEAGGPRRREKIRGDRG
jgi:hypothetical protein